MSISIKDKDTLSTTDTKQQIYTALNSGKNVKRGGQGVVLPVAEDNSLAIKLCFDKNCPSNDIVVINDPTQIKEFQAKLSNLKLLPIPHNAHFSMPIAILENYAGFVMRFLEAMDPIKRFLPQKSNKFTETKIADWIEANPDFNDYPKEFKQQLTCVAKTGGLRSRLSWMFELAALLNILHDNGLLFADISDNNVFITSEQPQQIWLIDVDNITLDSEMDSLIYTPGYAAPEVELRSENCSQFTDIFSYAVLAFETLCLIHPFDANTTPNTADSFRPWIFDSQDPSNHGGGTFFSLHHLSLPLFKLFQQTFEEGKDDAFSRPPLWMWQDVLKRTLDFTVQCPHCGMGYIFTEDPTVSCPFCNKHIPLWIGVGLLPALDADDFDSPSFSSELLFAHESSSEDTDLSLHLFAPTANSTDQTVVKIKSLQDEILLELVDQSKQSMPLSLVWQLVPKKDDAVLDQTNQNLLAWMKEAAAKQPASNSSSLHQSLVDLNQYDQTCLELAKALNLNYLGQNQKYVRLALSSFADHDLLLTLNAPQAWPIKLCRQESL